MFPVLLHLGVLAVPSYGAVTALGVLLALLAAQRTARRVGLDAGLVWNLGVAAILSALVVARVLLVVLNWRDLQRYPLWLLSVAMIHSSWLDAAGGFAGVVVAVFCARYVRLPLFALADALAAPVAIGMALEQVASFLAGSGFGALCTLPWAVVYRDPLAARWSGVPLNVPLHPVQLYAAGVDVWIALLCACLLTRLPQRGDVAGLWLLLMGVSVFGTEMFRARLSGPMDVQQVVAVGMVLLAAVVLWQRKLKVRER